MPPSPLNPRTTNGLSHWRSASRRRVLVPGEPYPAPKVRTSGSMQNAVSAGDSDLPRPEQAQGRQKEHLRPKKISKIACIGAGHVGGPTSAVIALMHPDLDVTVVDQNAQQIAAWNSTSLPVYEHDLYDIIRTCRDGILPDEVEGYPEVYDVDGDPVRMEVDTLMIMGVNYVTEKRVAATHRHRRNLFFSVDIKRAIEEAELIFISVNTPTKTHGVGEGYALDISNFEAAARSIAQYATWDKIVVEKSTVPCKTAQMLRDILEANRRPEVHFEVLSNPEFLAEGTAVRDLLQPARILIGSLPTTTGLQAAELLEGIYGKWLPRSQILMMNTWSSELSKLAANALLAQRVSSINALSAICEKTGADIEDVAKACGLDTRIGDGMFKASPGFGGSCFKKDVLSLVYMSESLNLHEVASYWKSIVVVNEHQKERFARRIISCLFDTLEKKKVAMLGFAYKASTSDTRESAAIDIVLQLAAEKAQLAIYDPAVKDEQIWRELANKGNDIQALRSGISVCHSAYEACNEAHAVVILTEWEMFSNRSNGLKYANGGSADGHRRRRLMGGHTAASPPGEFVSVDWQRIAQGMKKPRYVFDGRNIMDRVKLEELGFRVEAIGKAGGHSIELNHAD